MFLSRMFDFRRSYTDRPWWSQEAWQDLLLITRSAGSSLHGASGQSRHVQSDFERHTPMRLTEFRHRPPTFSHTCIVLLTSAGFRFDVGRAKGPSHAWTLYWGF